MKGLHPLDEWTWLLSRLPDGYKIEDSSFLQTPLGIFVLQCECKNGCFLVYSYN